MRGGRPVRLLSLHGRGAEAAAIGGCGSCARGPLSAAAWCAAVARLAGLPLLLRPRATDPPVHAGSASACSSAGRCGPGLPVALALALPLALALALALPLPLPLALDLALPLPLAVALDLALTLALALSLALSFTFALVRLL